MIKKDFKLVTPTCKKKNLCCVYKLIFESGHFYIGSTIDLAKRINVYLGEIRGYKGCKQRENFFAAIQLSTYATFEVVEACKPDFKLIRETFFIKKYWGNPLLINRCPTAFGCAGIVRNEKERQKIRERIKGTKFTTMGHRYRKKVVRVDSNMKILEEYESIQAACNKIGCTVASVKRIFNGINDTIYGHIVRLIDTEGKIIQPPIRDSKINPKKKGRKKGCSGVPSKFAKETIKFDLEGNRVESYRSIRQAAESIGVSSKQLKKSIKKSPRNYCKGFIWKCA